MRGNAEALAVPAVGSEELALPPCPVPAQAYGTPRVLFRTADLVAGRCPGGQPPAARQAALPCWGTLGLAPCSLAFQCGEGTLVHSAAPGLGGVGALWR